VGEAGAGAGATAGAGAGAAADGAAPVEDEDPNGEKLLAVESALQVRERPASVTGGGGQSGRWVASQARAPPDSPGFVSDSCCTGMGTCASSHLQAAHGFAVKLVSSGDKQLESAVLVFGTALKRGKLLQVLC
jgi:hypothetical protein